MEGFAVSVMPGPGVIARWEAGIAVAGGPANVGPTLIAELQQELGAQPTSGRLIELLRSDARFSRATCRSVRSKPLTSPRPPRSRPATRWRSWTRTTSVTPPMTALRFQAISRCSASTDVVYVDLGSTNGSFLWDVTVGRWQPIAPHTPVVLQSASTVSVGRMTFVFEGASRAVDAR